MASELTFKFLIQVKMFTTDLGWGSQPVRIWPENATQLYGFPNMDSVWAENSNGIFDLWSNAFPFSSEDFF